MRLLRATWFPTAALIVFAVLAVFALAGCGAHPSQTDPTTSVTTSTNPLAVGRTIVTAKVKRLQVYRLPHDAKSTQVLSNPNVDGAPLVMLTAGQEPGWYRVLLPSPPNGSEGWVRASDVTAKTTLYRLEIETKSHRLNVYRGSQQLINTKIAVGTKDTPTPGGEYYLTELIKTTSPAGPYGPYAYGLSGQSTTLKTFQGREPTLGLHGTNQPALLGHDVSHGCIRVSNAVITRLAGLLPLGAPVYINVG